MQHRPVDRLEHRCEPNQQPLPSEDMTTLMTNLDADVLRLQRNSRQIAAVVQKLRRSQVDARDDFRQKPLSRRKRVAERRRGLRQPLHVPVYLHPCTVSGSRIVRLGGPTIGVTRDVSDNGVGLSYDEPVGFPHVLAEFDIYGRGMVAMLVELRWTLRKSPHAYLAGGLWVGIAKEDR